MGLILLQIFDQFDIICGITGVLATNHKEDSHNYFAHSPFISLKSSVNEIIFIIDPYGWKLVPVQHSQ